jgi:hypothetical protein
MDNLDLKKYYNNFELYKTAYFIYLDRCSVDAASFSKYVESIMSQDDINKANMSLRKSKLKEIFNNEL